MTTLARWVRYGLFALGLLIAPLAASAAPYAALVMDARTGEVLYSKNADTRLHPASLTKMMTLYIAFTAIERGEISLDSMVTVSANAASQPPSRLGLRTGQKIALRYLIRAAAIKSANDAAAAIGDALGGDEARFAARMNQTAKALGMRNTTFRNANGLTREGHLSTARDMTLLGRRLFYDFPQYYNIFSRRTADAGMAKVSNTNRRFLDAYEGADGIKTGYTVPAGFNLTASAQRGGKRIIATMFGGTSTAQRNAKVAELLDLGFARAPGRVQEQRPEPPQLLAQADPEERADPVATAAASSGTGAKTIRVSGAPNRSPRPAPRPGVAKHDADAIALALAAAVKTAPDAAPDVVASAETEVEAAVETMTDVVAVAAPATATSPRPVPAPRNSFVQASAPQPETLELAAIPDAFDESVSEGDASPVEPVFAQSTEPQPETLAMTKATPETMVLAALTPPAPAPQKQRQVVARASSSGGRNWGISLGKYNSQYAAERALLQTALMESDTLGDALRKVATRKTGYEANFVGMTHERAELACARLLARSDDCTVFGP
ncbi:MAG: serine hydrolase [Paracoccaceae bacterium]|nr:serine hydrolase [Paracoccaceae bacterium]